MVKNRQIIVRVTGMVINGRLSRNDAAELLETSVRSVYNYTNKYAQYGPERLLDHRRGHYRKLTPDIEKQIVTCKAHKPNCSARWIRNWLKLNVSVETVREVLLKYNLNGNRKKPLRESPRL